MGYAPLEDRWVDNDGRLAPMPAASAPATLDGKRVAAAAAPPPRFAERIAVRSLGRIAIVPVDEIVRFEAEDNYVRIWANRLYLHKETLTRLCARLDPLRFLRIHRSHAINLRVLRELEPRSHGEFNIVLTDGTELRSGRSYRSRIEATLGLA